MLSQLRESMLRSALASAYGGALVFLIEAVDRIATLWPSFNSSLEPLLFAAYLTPAVLLGVGVGLGLGIVLAVVHAVYVVALSLASGRVPERWAPWAAGALTAVVLGTIARLTMKLAPDTLERPVFQLVRKFHGKLIRMPFVVDNFSWLLAIGLVIASALLVAVALAMATRPEKRVWMWRAGAVVVALAAIGMYALDSRFLYGRYELVIHIPATIKTLALAFVAAGLALASISQNDRARRAVALGAVAIVALSGLTVAFDAWHFGSNENLKALLWRRGVVARRAYQIATVATDRDGDGFSAFLGGGDADDRNANIHPLATEIPGNGIDENGFGGDGGERKAVAGGSPIAEPKGAGKNFILISIDTLRANRMSAYGYSRATSPRLAEWAAAGVFFERCYSQGTNTGQTFASLNRSATRGGLYDESRSSMFRRLKESGYRTAQVNARRDDIWLDGPMWAEYRRTLVDGIDEFTHLGGPTLWDSDKVTDHAIKYFESLAPSERHATWVHYFDPHAPRRKMGTYDWGNSDGDRYDTEVAFSDEHVGRLLDWLRETGRLDNTIVVLTSDHGEGLFPGEHGMIQHGNRPYDDQVHVPLMLWAPGIQPGRVSEPVWTPDIAPTVLGYLGLAPLPGAEGLDLLAGPPPAVRPLFLEMPRNGVEVTFFGYAVHLGTWRLIHDVVGNTTELYDLATDPEELHNRSDFEPARVAAMRALLAAWLDSTASVRPLDPGTDTGSE